MPQDEMHQITRKVAELVKINNHLDYAPHELSGGQKQRVSLAGVMVDQVKILLFDEPLANLDPATGKQTIELIDEIQKKTDTTVLIIEHRLEDVLWRNVDRIILVNEGTILADMTPDELLSTSLLADNGIREPLYVTAMRYAGIDITKEKRPAHVDSVVLNEGDRKRLQEWFEAQPFKEETGENFIEYVTKVRIEKAKEFLAQPDISIKEAGIRSGYTDPNYFSRIFKKQTDMTPSEYKTRYGK